MLVSETVKITKSRLYCKLYSESL